MSQWDEPWRWPARLLVYTGVPVVASFVTAVVLSWPCLVDACAESDPSDLTPWVAFLPAAAVASLARVTRRTSIAICLVLTLFAAAASAVYTSTDTSSDTSGPTEGVTLLLGLAGYLALAVAVLGVALWAVCCAIPNRRRPSDHDDTGVASTPRPPPPPESPPPGY